jgi:hypothetical protein
MTDQPHPFQRGVLSNVCAFEGCHMAPNNALHAPRTEAPDLRALMAEPHHLGFPVSGKTGTYERDTIMVKREWYERLTALSSATPAPERLDGCTGWHQFNADGTSKCPVHQLCLAPDGTYDGVEGGRPWCVRPCPHATPAPERLDVAWAEAEAARTGWGVTAVLVEFDGEWVATASPEVEMGTAPQVEGRGPTPAAALRALAARLRESGS